jgi:HAD superfamily hydrolase (TIGR01457 family)
LINSLDGGIGRRSGLKIRREQSCTGSIPVPGTVKNQRFQIPKAFLLDLDGTLYVGPRVLEDALEFLSFLRINKIPYLFLTNNSSQSATEYYDKLKDKGFKLDLSHILTSGDSSIGFIKNSTEFKRVYVVGTPSLEQDFIKAGFILDEEEPQCVVLGFDTGITYRKLEIAARHIYKGLPYYATQPDITCITERGLTPDVGVFIAGLKVMTGRQPEILGKPSKVMVDAAMERLGINSMANVAIVGDQLDTDITMGVENNLISMLVLSGETDKFKTASFPLKPSFVFEHVGEILQEMKELINS